MISISHMCNSHVMYGSVVTPPPWLAVGCSVLTFSISPFLDHFQKMDSRTGLG